MIEVGARRATLEITAPMMSPVVEAGRLLQEVIPLSLVLGSVRCDRIELGCDGMVPGSLVEICRHCVAARQVGRYPLKCAKPHQRTVRFTNGDRAVERNDRAV